MKAKNTKAKYGKIFISYRREGGGEMARLIMIELRQRGYEVFMDVEDLRSGAFNLALLEEMKTATDVIVVLSPHSLERCQNEGDWLRREITYALKAEKNVIPLMMRGFEWPTEPLPPEIRDLGLRNGLAPTHEMFQASIERLTSFLLARPKPAGWGARRQGQIMMVISALSLLVSLTIALYSKALPPVSTPSSAESPLPPTPGPPAIPARMEPAAFSARPSPNKGATPGRALPAAGATSLFNGKDLTGWQPLFNDIILFQAKDAMIAASFIKDVDNSSNWLRYQKEFADFDLEFDIKSTQTPSHIGVGFRMSPTGGCPVFFMQKKDDINLMGSPDRISVASPQDHDYYKPNEWNHVRLVVIGQHIQTWINDKAVDDVTGDTSKPKLPPKGCIGFWIGQGIKPQAKIQEAFWKNIQIREYGSGSAAPGTNSSKVLKGN